MKKHQQQQGSRSKESDAKKIATYGDTQEEEKQPSPALHDMVDLNEPPFWGEKRFLITVTISIVVIVIIVVLAMMANNPSEPVPVSKYCNTAQIEAEKKGLIELQRQIDVDLKSIEDKNSPQHKSFCYWIKEKTGAFVIQRFVLMFIYFQLNGDTWKKCAKFRPAIETTSPCPGSTGENDNRLRFLSEGDPCKWKGIECIGDDIVGLEMGGFFSTKTVFNVTSEWKFLTNLKTIDFSSSSMVGSLPAMLGELKKLMKLNLSSNSLTGSIPAMLGDLTKLQKLNLSSNRLTGTIPSWIATFQFLETLNLHGNMFDGTVPSELCSLQSLKKITVTCPNSTKSECTCCTCRTCTCK